ncbi:MAG: hypothetical protein U9N54_02135, partial [candidate division Zixibacteria bacterium]|nr:hypothetical protein [candidate division Zixibacteria bacterium]
KNFIVSVFLDKQKIEITYNKPFLSPFRYKYEILVDGEIKEKTSDNSIRVFNLLFPHNGYTFSIYIDEHIAFKGYYVPN